VGRIVVTGSTGFLGRHLMPILNEHYGSDNVIGLSSQEYDLMDPGQVERMFADLEPEYLIHLAAYSGGIGINRELPADFYYRNTLLTALVFQEAAERGVRKMLYPLGGCSYPGEASSPIDEGQMWNGLPHNDSLGYAMAKKMGIVASMSYRTQFDFNSVVLIPGNMYGEYDNFRKQESHVIPAMIRRYYEARRDDAAQVVMWGTGEPVRDFVYAGDVASVFARFLETYDSSEPINISTGTTTTIRALAETVKELVSYEGEMIWDSSKPNGQMVKIFDVTRMRDLGFSCPTTLHDGLERTIRWFEANYEAGTDGIRL